MIIDGKNVLILHLKEKWWNMIKSGEKTEEYCRATIYWTKRLIEIVPVNMFFSDRDGNVVLRDKNYYQFYKHFDEAWLLKGYPKLTESDKIIKWVSPMIVFRQGFPEWGAPENESVFVIKEMERWNEQR